MTAKALFHHSSFRKSVQGGVILTGVCLLFFYAPLFLYPLASQRMIFPFLGIALLLHLLSEDKGGNARKGLQVSTWACLLMAFLVSLETWVEEIISLYQLYGHFYTIVKTHSQAWTLLSQSISQKGDTLWMIWGTWGAVSGILLVVLLISTPALLIKPLKADLDRTTKGPWTSGFMEKERITQLARNISGLPLGQYKGKMLRYQPQPEKGWLGGHHAVFAGSRAGKGVSCVIPAILDHDGPLVCLDIKGENFAVTKKYRESLGRKVVVLNPYGVIEKSSDGFNPLDYIRKKHISRDVHVITDGIVKPEVGMNAHFTDLVRDLLAASIGVHLKQKKRPTLADISQFFSSPDFLDEINKWAESPDEYGQAPAKIATAFLSAGDKEQGSILTTLQRNTGWLSAKEIQKTLSKSNFALSDLLENKSDLFIVVPMDILKQLENFLRLFTNMILGEIIRQDGYKRPQKPILMVLDEFTRLGRMEKFLDIATVAAGCGVEALFVAQDKGQVDAIWGREGTGTILGSCATVRAFGLGRTDSVTARWVEEQLGFETILTHSKNKGKGKKSESTSEHKNRLLTSTQVQELSPDEMLCFIRSQKPLKLTRVKYYKDKAYKGKVERNPLLG